MKEVKEPCKGEVQACAQLLKESRQAMIEVVGRGIYWMVKTIALHVDCDREYDDDAPVCIECKHYALCDSIAEFEWMLEEDGDCI